MKNFAFLFATLIVMLILSACSPFMITNSSGQQPTPVIEAYNTEAPVQSIEVGKP